VRAQHRGSRGRGVVARGPRIRAGLREPGPLPWGTWWGSGMCGGGPSPCRCCRVPHNRLLTPEVIGLARGNIARSALAGQGAAAVAAARFAALPCRCSPPTTTAIARPPIQLHSTFLRLCDQHSKLGESAAALPQPAARHFIRRFYNRAPALWPLL
jgi:hypothetical protein